MQIKLYWWLEVFAAGEGKRFFRGSVFLKRFKARLSLHRLSTTYNDEEIDWEWPGQETGVVTLELEDDQQLPDYLHVIVHYHDNYFDHLFVYTTFEAAESKYKLFEQEEFVEVQSMKYDEGIGLFKASQYQCEQVTLDHDVLTRPDKGSSWALLRSVRVEK